MISAPDPKRFSHMGQPSPGWNGEYNGMPKKVRSLVEERVIIAEGGKVEFREQGAFDEVEMPKELTQKERELLAGGWNSKKKYDPNNVLYSKAKAIFADYPHITNAELSEKSGVNIDTMKDVAAIFRYSFETLLREYQRKKRIK